MSTLRAGVLEAAMMPFSPERFRLVVDEQPRAPLWAVRSAAERALEAGQIALVRGVILDAARDVETRAAALAALDDVAAPLGDPQIAVAVEALLACESSWARVFTAWWLRDHPRAEVAPAVARLLSDERMVSDMDAIWRVANEAAVALAALPSLSDPLRAALDGFVAHQRTRLAGDDATDRELAAATLKALADRCAFTPP